MSLWNPYSFAGYPLIPRHPRDPFSLADHLFDDFDSMFEVPSRWLVEYMRERPLTVGRNVEISNTDEMFKINLSVEDFKGDELSVKLIRDRFVVIHGEKKKIETTKSSEETPTKKEGDDDETKKTEGEERETVTREFTRSFLIPKDVDLGKFKSSLSKDGILTVQAAKVRRASIENERRVVIEQEGGEVKK